MLKLKWLPIQKISKLFNLKNHQKFHQHHFPFVRSDRDRHFTDQRAAVRFFPHLRPGTPARQVDGNPALFQTQHLPERCPLLTYQIIFLHGFPPGPAGSHPDGISPRSDFTGEAAFTVVFRITGRWQLSSANLPFIFYFIF